MEEESGLQEWEILGEGEVNIDRDYFAIEGSQPNQALDLRQEKGNDFAEKITENSASIEDTDRGADSVEIPILSPQFESVVEVREGKDSIVGDGGRLPMRRVGNSGSAWWRLPLELIKFLGSRIRPGWSVTIAAALMGLFMLGKKLYRRKPRIRRIPLKASVDNEVSPFVVPVSRLNGVVSAVKHIPDIRASLPTAGATPWPVVALR